MAAVMNYINLFGGVAFSGAAFVIGLNELYSNETPEDIVRMEPDFLADVGITQHLSPNRRNGLTGVREKIKAYAQMQIEHAD